MGKCYVVKIFYFAICVDIMRQAVDCFKICRVVFFNVDGEECFNDILNRDGTSIRSRSFGMSDMVSSLDRLGMIQWKTGYVI